MTKRRTIINITVQTDYGWGLAMPCDSMATAHYYLAHRAASAGYPLVEVIPDYNYRIAGLTYLVAEQELLTTPAVGRLRREHEPCPPPPL